MSIRNFARRLALQLSLAAVFPAILAAQSSSLQGVISDAQAGGIPDAILSVTNTETASSRKVVTGGGGAYVIPQLPPGVYKVEVQKPGFRTLWQQVTLPINTPVTLDLKLEVGQVSEVVNVTEEMSSVNTTNATLGNAFNEVQVRQLPLQTRNVVALLSLQPGVTANGEVLGAKRDQNNVTLDGVDVNDQQNSGLDNTNGIGLTSALPVPLDSVQEFRVTVAGQTADQGRSSGGQVSLVTKSGSNQFHGSLYDFNRNRALAANDWFSNRAGIPRENLIRNQYGVSLGGRVVRDRVFFFANWEDRKDRSASAQSRDVPTETLKQGVVRFRQSDGTIGQLTAAEILQVDPLKQGYNSTMRGILQAYPNPNDLQSGSDRGLNFGVFRFNAPLRRDDRAYVAKMDFNLDQSAKHTLMLRGTLADGSRDQVLAQFPGQDSAAKILDNSRGLAGRYTAVISPSLVNVLSVGYTRLGIAQSGTPGTSISFGGVSSPSNFTTAARGFGRIIPTTNIVNDLTYLKGRHTVQGGINFRLIQNDRSSFANSFASYSFSRNTLRGLGADVVDSVNAYIQQRAGNSSLRLTENLPVVNALGNLYGVINQYSATYNFGRDGSAVPFGQPVARSFGTREYEFYVQDTFKWRPDLTVTYGIRYGSYQVPYEKNGVQVVSTVGLDRYFADRVGASMAGISGASVPTAALTYALGGPANNGPGWFKRDTNNWAPRLNVAYAPVSDSLAGRLFGKGSVLRFGGAMVYDRYGSDMVVNFDRTGSPGLASPVTQPRNTNFADSARYAGGALPTLPTAPAAKFPYTPATILGGFGSYTGVYPDLVAPYSILLNASYTRPLVSNMTIEVGYVGRLARKVLTQVDVFQPLTQFRDPKSGQTWTQASGILRDYYERGLKASQIPAVPFFENMFPGAAGSLFPGTATQNYFGWTYDEYAGSDLDALNEMDRERRPDGTCYSITGCNTFFSLQNAGNAAWTNGGRASFYGGTVTLRRAVSRGWGFDFNYTLSHSIDNSPIAESGAGSVQSGSNEVLQDAFNPQAFRGSSMFDIRHNITANSVVEIPFGKGKPFLSGVPGWANQFIGGWQASMLWRYRSGLPLNISNGGVYPTNYLNSAIAILRSGASMPENGVGFNQAGNPSLFRNTNAVNSFMGQYPGQTGTRSILRNAPMTNFDLSLGKFFFLPFEGHRIQVRAEAFNAFNNVNFTTANLSLANPSNFGQFSAVMPARVIQFALRYEF